MPHPQNTKIYLLPGLGADHRLFERLPPTPGVEWKPLPWLPVGEAKTAADYARKLAAHHRLESPYMLGGVSLGGLVAQEWAKIARPEGVVLISTLGSEKEMPPFVRATGNIGMHRMLGKSMLVGVARIADRFTFKSPRGRELFVDMLRNSPPELLRFGTDATFTWKHGPLNAPVLRIHGNRDMVFPLGRISEAEVIDGGNHYMIYEKAEEIAAIIGRFVASRNP